MGEVTADAAQDTSTTSPICDLQARDGQIWIARLVYRS